MEFFTTALFARAPFVTACGAGCRLWVALNLMKVYGVDDPASKSQGGK